jgi:lysine 2,3-aminomutase
MEDMTVEAEEPPGQRWPPSSWRSVSSERRNDWRWQRSHRLNAAEELGHATHLSPDEIAGLSLDRFRPNTIPLSTNLMAPDNPGCPIRRQVVLTARELAPCESEMADSLGAMDVLADHLLDASVREGGI